MQRNLRFSIDRGGTFTDVFAEIPDGHGGTHQRVLKLLSEDPSNYRDAPQEGIRRLLEEITGIAHPRSHPVDTSRILSIRMGTTVATNALLERKGERCALVTSKGFRDLLHIGNQSRPEIFDLEIRVPDLLYDQVVEVDEQVILPLGDDPKEKRNGLKAKQNAGQEQQGTIVTGLTGEAVCIRRSPDLSAVRAALQGVARAGISSLAIVLKHSFIFPDHEEAVGRVAQELGFSQISLSSKVMQMVKMVPRGFTAAADAYLTPCIFRYIHTFQSGFDAGLKDVQLAFMQSDGGLSPVDLFSGHKAILSGPAGGYVGYALTTKWPGVDTSKMEIIGFDMGGTSTDVSRYAGSYEHVFESTTAGVTIQAPQLDINTVAAGGGSRLFHRSGVLQVGPESAGAHPGPVCYRKGGFAAVTDANLVLGRILPEFFPKIFGQTEDQPLDEHAAHRALQELTDDINQHAEPSQGQKSVDEVAQGFVKVANEAMCRPIRALTQMRGYNVANHVLSCFGGAGGQHACAIARSLGMRTIFVHRYSGVLSAVGIGLADMVAERQKPKATVLTRGTQTQLKHELEELEREAVNQLHEQGFHTHQIGCEQFLNLRYEGTDVAVMTSCSDAATFAEAFEQSYRREFGFILEGRKICVDDMRVRAAGRAIPLPDAGELSRDPGPLPKAAARSSAYFENGGRQTTHAYHLQKLRPGHRITGPAILLDQISTVVVDPQCTALITPNTDIRIEVHAEENKETMATTCDPIQLAIFSHRFMGIAEQMGRALQRTSISVNIKERLDFSCAMFGPDGALVANAPHLPVHLGAMSEAVRFQLHYWTQGEGRAHGLKEGEVLVSNHPQLAGGSHLPDITVITPVFDNGRIVFCVASRGHHQDVGGTTPGSMPPNSQNLAEEGAAILAFKLVENGKFQERGITNLLKAPSKAGKHISGTRALTDNLSDLKAQVAANNKGVQLVGELIQEFTLDVVQAYMQYIQDHAEKSVRQMLRDFSQDRGLQEVDTVSAEDQMDDGSKIKLAVTINRKEGSAIFNFEGTDSEIIGNLNAPPAVTRSAIIYTLRCMVPDDIPLNQGCLKPIDIRIPEHSLLCPGPGAAVVGGNVLTSQRVTDVVLKAFLAASASQGCMNNFTFGDSQMGYYETIAGGAGAGPSWHGRSGVHTHMTNTRITDPEIYERRFPVVLHEFSLRHGSGGAGKFNGGDGVIREVLL
ncbi:hypothetical protein WJX84_006445 [Apatococcus fuscideae]|uniref:5-oxoprolinase n=1 Tax=Apatococcus fuscideae TaxID=2026836 RepID=A0AAW1TI30_9CHLO